MRKRRKIRRFLTRQEVIEAKQPKLDRLLQLDAEIAEACGWYTVAVQYDLFRDALQTEP